MSVGWSSGHGGSEVMRHEWKGLLKMQGRLEDLVEKQRLESQERSANRSGGVQDDADSDDDYMSESGEEDDE
jgi:DDB1- and CUL4-associated factor 11